MAKPVGFYIDTYGTARVKDSTGNTMTDGEIALKTIKLFDMRPYEIVRRFGLKNPIFEQTASYGHFGRDPYEKEVELKRNGNLETKKVTFFGWEKLDRVEDVKAAFKL